MEKKFYYSGYVHGITIDLIDNSPYDNLDIDIWIGNLYLGSYKVPYHIDIDDDHFGRNTAIFKTLFKPFKTTEVIKVVVKTKLLYNDQITMHLLVAVS